MQTYMFHLLLVKDVLQLLMCLAHTCAHTRYRVA